MIFYITTHSNNYKQALKIKELFSNTSFTYYFVYGKNNTNKIKPYIEVDAEESYENLPLKTHLLVKHFVSTSHSRMVKMDDDTYVNFKNLPTFKEDYIGIFVEYQNNIKSKIYHWYKIQNPLYKIYKTAPCIQYAEGSFYSLSKKAAYIIANTDRAFFVNTPETYIGEDIRTGMLLQSSDISKKDIKEYYTPLYETTHNIATIHPIHYSLFDKLSTCNSSTEIIDILNTHKLFNHNFKREIYLESILKHENIINNSMQ